MSGSPLPASLFFRWWPHRLAGVALAALGLTPVTPLFFASRPWSADANGYLYHVVEFEALLRQGVLYPRWAADLDYGYGFPLSHSTGPAVAAVALLATVLQLSALGRLSLGLYQDELVDGFDVLSLTAFTLVP